MQGGETGYDRPHCTRFGVAGALHGWLGRGNKLQRTDVLCGARRIVVGLGYDVLPTVYGELAVKMVSGAREP